MATSLGIITVLGLLSKALFKKMKLPGLLGMILVGVVLGPYGFNIISEEMMIVSADFRKIALIVILLRAGFGISREDLNKVGIKALKLSTIPLVLEGLLIAYLSIELFDFTFIQGGILGFIIAAVSPAVIVPSMLEFVDRGLGKEKAVPALILAGASVDDVVAITIFSAFLGIYGGSNINIGIKILSIPLSIALGILLGIVLAIILVKIFKRFHIRDTKKVLYIIGGSILLIGFEDLLKPKVDVAGLLGVMAIGFIILQIMPNVGKRMSIKLNKIWVFAEILLFVLVGAQVNVALALHAGWKGIILIFLGLAARSIGVFISLLGSNLNRKEKLFCVISYIPKATVQAAIGAIPLSLGVESGDLILSLAVLSIVITAPIGAILINLTGDMLLS